MRLSSIFPSKSRRELIDYLRQLSARCESLEIQLTETANKNNSIS